MEKYKTLFVKIALNNTTNSQVMLNYEHLCNLHTLLELACILPLLECVHALIKFAQSRNVFMCDLVQPSRFIKLMFIACIVIKLLSSLLIAFGLSNHY
jgi:hypothetical protein